MSDYIYSKDGHKRYKAVCRQCGADRGYQAPSKLDRVCLKCYRKKLEDRFVEPTKEYSFINYGDTVVKHDRVRYRASCPQCGKDRGYKRPNKFNRVCMDCQVVRMRAGCSVESHKKQGLSMLGKAPWNKGNTTPEQKKLRHCISSLVNHKLQKHGGIKDISIKYCLPYSMNELRDHLEKQFYSNPRTGELMTWRNRGLCGWHIDHVIPDSAFKYQSVHDEGFKKSWALENLQPLWWFENLKKGSKV